MARFGQGSDSGDSDLTTKDRSSGFSAGLPMSATSSDAPSVMDADVVAQVAINLAAVEEEARAAQAIATAVKAALAFKAACRQLAQAFSIGRDYRDARQKHEALRIALSALEAVTVMTGPRSFATTGSQIPGRMKDLTPKLNNIIEILAGCSNARQINSQQLGEICGYSSAALDIINIREKAAQHEMGSIEEETEGTEWTPVEDDQAASGAASSSGPAASA